MKVLSLTLLILLMACKSSVVSDLYNKDHPLYNRLKEMNAEKCKTENEIFDNLKTSDFTEYDLINGSGYIKVSSDTYIIIHSYTASNVVFEVKSDVGVNTTYLPFLSSEIYEIDTTTNNAIVDMIAEGVCAEKLSGNPESSNSTLTFSATYTQIEDGASDVDSSEEYLQRKDSFTLTTSVPAFLFIWAGKYQGYEKNDGSSVAENNFIDTDLSLVASNDSDCDSAVGSCTISSGTSGETMSVNGSAYDQLSSSNVSILKQTYYTNIP